LNTDEIKLEKAGNGTFRAVIPIFGRNKQMGMVVVEYVPSAYTPQ
jgi:hypothetical protein